MKKLLQIIAVVSLMLYAIESNAQVTNGTLSADWTFTDIAGTSQNLYTYLNAGKTVVIDISAAWCGPCWSYHNSGALDALWAAHGPLGGNGVSSSSTDDMMVFFIEGELTNTSNQLHGIQGSTGNSYADYTQGDWTLNTNYPIIDLSNATPGASALLTGYHLTYFPTCVMICPDRTVTEVDQYTAAQLYTSKGTCSIAVGANDAQLMAPSTLSFLNSNLQSCDSVIPTFRLGNLGTTTLTSATITYDVDGVTQKVKNWTGTLVPYSNATVTGIKLGSPVAGSHIITATVSNPNGSTDPTSVNNVSTAGFIKYSNTVGQIVSENFETSGIPSNWVISNGGDPATWSNASVGFNSAHSAKLSFYNSTSGDVDYFSFEPMSFSGATAVQLTFDVSYAQYSSTVNDKLQVDVSTNCGVSWTPRYVKAGSSLSTNGTTYFTSEYAPTSAAQWRHETVNFPSSYLGQPSVLVRFKGTSAQGNDVYVDNVNFSVTTGIDEASNFSEVNVYPNPASDIVNVEFNLSEVTGVSIELTDELGQQLVKSEQGNLSTGMQKYSLNTDRLSNGLYFVSVKTNKGVITKKLSVNK